jgi:hypothetical protein
LLFDKSGNVKQTRLSRKNMRLLAKVTIKEDERQLIISEI